jgi:hypothetical protein
MNDFNYLSNAVLAVAKDVEYCFRDTTLRVVGNECRLPKSATTP